MDLFFKLIEAIIKGFFKGFDKDCVPRKRKGW